MRRKREMVLTFEGNDEGLPKVVREYRAKYRALSQVLDGHPEILDAVHEDLKALSTANRKGRKGDYTSENLLRALLVMAVEGLDYRETVVRIGGDVFLQEFCRLRKKAVMDFGFLDKCHLAIRPETWLKINQLLGRKAAEKNMIDPDVIRTDTTVIEANIHYPTDASLLWDVWRVASRELKKAREIAETLVPHRFHNRKVKGLYLYITRYIVSKDEGRQRQVRKRFRALIARTEQMAGIVADFCEKARKHADFEVQGIALKLKGYLPTMRRITAQARRAVIEGETVPAAERVFSLFEPHVELIKRGKREKPIEFGHKLLLCQTQEKFITDYEVLESQVADSALTAEVVRRHEQQFGRKPMVLAADMGFRPASEEFARLEEEIVTLCIPHRLRDFTDKIMKYWQAFRSGIEGTISTLKRAFRLFRCFLKGFKGYARGVGLSILAHNLLVLARLPET
jgi:transposase, IS5 family